MNTYRQDAKTYLAFKTPRSDSCQSHMERVFARLGVPKHWWVKYMMQIPHTFVFGLIMYSMVCKTTRYVWYFQGVASMDTKVIKVLIVGQQWKMSLSTRVSTDDMFSCKRRSWRVRCKMLHRYSLHLFSMRFSI